MLKNVVLPAPLGPMIETIDLLGIVERDVVDRDEAAEDLRDARGASRTPSPALRGTALGAHAAVAHARRTSSRASVGADALGELELAPSLGKQALRAQHHHDHEQEAEDPEVSAA